MFPLDVDKEFAIADEEGVRPVDPNGFFEVFCADDADEPCAFFELGVAALETVAFVFTVVVGGFPGVGVEDFLDKFVVPFCILAGVCD